MIAVLALAVCGCGDSSKSTASSGADYSTLVGAGVALLGKGNVGAAEQLFTQAIAKDPDAPVGHYDLGVAYQRAGDVNDALVQYSRALLVNSHYVPALFNQAEIYSSRNPLLAMFYYRQVIRIQPRSPTAFLNLGLLEYPSDQAQALPDLARAVQLQPSLRAQVPPPLLARLPRTKGR